MKYLIVLLLLSGCMGYDVHEPNTPVDPNYIVKAIAYMSIGVSTSRGVISSNTSQSSTIVVTTTAQTIMTLVPFTNPDPIDPDSTTKLVSIGNIEVSDLFDNDLRQCSGLGNKCNNAAFRLRMVNQAGLVNQSDVNEIIPIQAKDSAGNFVLLTTDSVIFQSISIGAFKFNVSLSDFNPVPSYEVQVDLTNAGAGTFSGTLIVEYVIYD